MTTPSEKHREIATELWQDATNAVCQTMQEEDMCRCADGACVAARVNPQPADLAAFTRTIAAALASAEREGMKRAADIAQTEAQKCADLRKAKNEPGYSAAESTALMIREAILTDESEG